MSREVHDMFAGIAGSYDKANSVLSLGVHHRWRKQTVRRSAVRPGDHVLDCATGTGDLALEFKRAVGVDGRVVGTDFCAEMLALAPAKSRETGLAVEWEVEDVMDLSYPEDSFEVASIAFGIRNVDDPVQALRSMGRVVRPGGRVIILEFGRPLWWMKPLFTFYSKVIIPSVGGLISGRRDAYMYLTQTSAAFPTGPEFLTLMDKSGMYAERRVFPLTGGIAYLYIGIVA
ncbi:MAG: ubiquinone/menaquinone biosynthesis methyltransferase [Bacteroidetes bacterium]|nr:ubiquinone/menaquinone biosynthesis methyltransferase [Bacteroidota bacterium]